MERKNLEKSCQKNGEKWRKIEKKTGKNIEKLIKMNISRFSRLVFYIKEKKN